MVMPKDINKIKETKEKMRLARKGKTWEQIFGTKKAKELKAKKAIYFKQNNPGKNPLPTTKEKMSVSARKRGLEGRGSSFQKGNNFCLMGNETNDITKVSRAEQIMRKLLPSDFIHGKAFADIGVPDFRSEERKIIIEVDGNWHREPRHKEIDERHMKAYKELGYQVFRMPNRYVYKYMECMI